MSKYLVFSHGFGVRADSLGLFSYITGKFPNYESVLFDFYDVDESSNTWKVPALSIQADTLAVKLENVFAHDPQAEVNIIAHSQGCVIVSLLDDSLLSRIRNILLLAPAMQSVDTIRFRKFFTARGAAISSVGEIDYIKRDGVELIISTGYQAEAEKLNLAKQYQNLRRLGRIKVILGSEDRNLASADETVLSEIKEFKPIWLPADHNFTGSSRAELMAKLHELL